MAHPLEATIREAYAAFGRGNVDGYLQPCTKDFSFNIPGRGAIAGSWRGKEGLWELARLAMEVTEVVSGKRLKTCWPTITTL